MQKNSICRRELTALLHKLGSSEVRLILSNVFLNDLYLELSMNAFKGNLCRRIQTNRISLIRMRDVCIIKAK